MQQSVEEPVFAKETEEIHVVLNQEQVEHETMAEEEERYFLVAEEGYLIVYDKGKGRPRISLPTCRSQNFRRKNRNG